MTDVEARPCICGKLWGLDRAVPEQFAVCLCGETLTIRGGSTWFLQHGPNPEHRSPDYEGDNLLAACDWVDAVCLNVREAQGD